MTTLTGRCLCGAVTYRITAEPVASRICWCRDCQHIASNGTANIIVPAESLEVSGALTEFHSTADSGNHMVRKFCPACGSHLFATSSGRPHLVVVRAGTFDDTSTVHPTANIWCASAPGWAQMDSRLEKVDRQPAPPAKR